MQSLLTLFLLFGITRVGVADDHCAAAESDLCDYMSGGITPEPTAAATPEPTVAATEEPTTTTLGLPTTTWTSNTVAGDSQIGFLIFSGAFKVRLTQGDPAAFAYDSAFYEDVENLLAAGLSGGVTADMVSATMTPDGDDHVSFSFELYIPIITSPDTVRMEVDAMRAEWIQSLQAKLPADYAIEAAAGDHGLALTGLTIEYPSTPEPTAAATPEPTAAATPEPTAAATPEPTVAATPEPTSAAVKSLQLVTIAYTFDGAYDDVVGSDKTKFLEECTAGLEDQNSICSDVRAGSIIVDITGASSAAAAAVSAIKEDGKLDLPSFDSMTANSHAEPVAATAASANKFVEKFPPTPAPTTAATEATDADGAVHAGLCAATSLVVTYGLFA